MPIEVESIYRYPVKGLNGEPLDRVALARGQGLPWDRCFALARGDAKLDASSPHWLPKERFVMLMRDADLARLACSFDIERRTIELRASGKEPRAVALDAPEAHAEIEACVNAFLGPRREGPARWIEAGEASFTDVPQNCVTLVNLESVRELEARMGRVLDPLRFRANLYVRDAAPWAEFDWVGGEIAVGEVRLRVPSRIPRCAATGVDPKTGERDLNVVRALRDGYGHYDMGIYCEVVREGTLAVGDTITPPRGARSRSRTSHWLHLLVFLARSAPVVLRRK